jgi:hypothetical protein
MPANIESMFSVRQMPWHREGTICDDYPGTWADARTLAGLDWDPVTATVYAVVGINADGSEHYEPISGWKTISRSDTGAVLSSARTPTPSSTTAKWARSSKRSSPSPM